MDWKLVVSAFGLIFLAELGDKNQLAAISLTATTQKPWSVFLGASLGLVVVSAVGVAAGSALAEVVPLDWVRKLGALAFVLIGVAMLLDWV